jgi:serine/threonine-protein kinase
MPVQVGHYTIVRTLGSGGMGDVHVAHDDRLKRNVALKSIRADRRLNASAKARFMREARILSSLDHPNICRIYDYVESAESDYLVLELIDGETLSHAIKHGLDRAAKLRIAEQLARVLVAAHAAGVVHRDLKPDNVMVMPSGDIKVLDFGIARPVGEQTEGLELEPAHDDAEDATEDRPVDASDDDRTLAFFEMAANRDRTRWSGVKTEAGQIVGTPMFMSPEQAIGSEVTAASDMYSYGLLVQVLFTGKVPYEGSLDPHDLVGKATRGETLPIQGVNRDLAALVSRLKSIAPSDRPTAVEAADRLKWIREKPRRRLRNGVIACVLALAALGGLKYTVDLSRERTQAVHARDDAEDLLTFMLGDLRDRLAPVGRLDVLDGVGDKALDYFAGLPEDALDDEALYRRTKALRLIGEVRMAEGTLAAAETAFAESLSLSRDLAERDPSNGEWQVGLGASVFYLGAIAMEHGDHDGAMAGFTEYQDIAERLVALDAANPDWQMELAYAHTNRGAVHQSRGEVEKAHHEFARSIEIKRDIVALDPEDRARRRGLANSLSWFAETLQDAGDLDAALERFAEELEIREQLVAEEPDDYEARAMLSTSHSQLAEALEDQGRPREALAHCRAMRGLARELVAMDPENAQWQRELAVSHRQLGRIWTLIGDLDAARLELGAGRALLLTLAERDPSNIEWQTQLVRIHRAIADLAITRETWDDATTETTAARAILEPVVAADAGNLFATTQLGAVCLLEGRTWEGRGDASRARDAWEAALALVEPLARKTADPDLREVWATALLHLDRVEEAAPLVDDLLASEPSRSKLAALALAKGALRADAEGDSAAAD